MWWGIAKNRLYVKDLLKEAVTRADSMNYKFDGNKNRKPKKNAESTKTLEQAAASNASSPNLSGILSELCSVVVYLPF